MKSLTILAALIATALPTCLMAGQTVVRQRTVIVNRAYPAVVAERYEVQSSAPTFVSSDSTTLSVPVRIRPLRLRPMRATIQIQAPATTTVIQAVPAIEATCNCGCNKPGCNCGR